MTDAAFLTGLLESGTAGLAADDVMGPHGPAIRHWQDLGFVAREPAAHPAPGCPHCGKGVPYPLGGRTLCDRCFGEVDPQWLRGMGGR